MVIDSGGHAGDIRSDGIERVLQVGIRIEIVHVAQIKFYIPRWKFSQQDCRATATAIRFGSVLPAPLRQ